MEKHAMEKHAHILHFIYVLSVVFFGLQNLPRTDQSFGLQNLSRTDQSLIAKD